MGKLERWEDILSVYKGIFFRECTISKSNNYYRCIRDRAEEKMKNDFKCNLPAIDFNKVNKDMSVCTNMQDLKKGKFSKN